MARNVNLTEILKSGTPKQKALLLIENEEASNRMDGAFLKESEEKAIVESVKKKPTELKELKLYLDIASKYMENRFRLYGLQENLKKLSARIAGFCYIWELAEQQAEFCNTLLRLVDAEGVKNAPKVAHRGDVEKYIYQNCREWSRYAPIKRKKGADGELREVEVDLSQLRELIDGVVADYASSLAVAKAFSIASDEFLAKYHATAFVPADIKEMFKYYKSPKTEVPEIYRRDAFLKIKESKGEDDREVKYREKYAILPSWEEIEPRGLNNAREAFSI